jgi:rubredoxin
MNHSNSVDFIYCPVCETGRAKPKASAPRFKDGFRTFFIGVATAVVLAALGEWILGLWLGLLFGVLSFTVSEVYYSAKLKRELKCPVCHFDPILYKRSPEKAKEQCLGSLKVKEDVFLAKWQALKRGKRTT